MSALWRRTRSVLSELRASRTARGPYRFLLKRFDAVTDIRLAAAVLGTDVFEKQLAPVPLPIDRFSRVVVLAPHQDDELIGAGGTLLLARDAGVDVHIVYMTDGVQLSGPLSPHDSARTRREEAAQVCAALGASWSELGISNAHPQPTRMDVERLAGVLRDRAPDVVLLPWVLDSPAKHRLVNHLLWLAYTSVGLPSFETWGYQVHNLLPPNGYVDVTSVAAEKRALLAMYQSQERAHRRFSHIAMGLSAWNSRFTEESDPPSNRFVELFCTLPVADAMSLVERFYFRSISETYRGNAGVVTGMTALHREMSGSDGQRWPRNRSRARRYRRKL